MGDTNTAHIAKKVVDIHMHIGGKGNSTKCYMSSKFLLSPAYFYMVLRSGISLKKLHKDHDKALRDVMIKRLNKAPSIDYGVFLAHDAVYDTSGNIDSANSHMITPNDYVMEIAQNNKKVLFGASVHPNRGKDNGIKEIDRCIKGGAVLMKWIPNSHMIDPSDEKYEWFYEKLAAQGIPLLCHTGPEHAVPVPNDDSQELGNPLKLKLPLEKGVTVIAAHCSTAYFPGEKSYLPELRQLFDEAQKPENKWNLYADISAM